ncbi:unnamed protein product, partial [Laminaria digitata]
DLFFQILSEVDKDPTAEDGFLGEVEKLVDDGADVLEACRSLSQCQKNGFPRAKKNTYIVQHGKCQGGKGKETYIGFLKSWLQAKEAPVFITKNDSGEVGRHNDGMDDFDTYSARIWKLAGLTGESRPILSTFEGNPKQYERSLKQARDGSSVIPVYALIDNPTRMKILRGEVVPIISKICGTTDGAANMRIFADEADLTFRNKETVGARRWTDPFGGWKSLYEACSSITFITATSGAIHLSENRMGSKTHDFQQGTTSSNYWDYHDPSQELPPNARVISRAVGDLECMVRKMASPKSVQCALAIESSVSHNHDIDKEAKQVVVKYPREGVKNFVSLAWMAEQLLVYTADAGMRKVFGSETFFNDYEELGEEEVVEIERELRKEEAKKRKKGKRRKKGAEECEEEEPEEEESDEEDRAEEEPIRVFRYTPAEKKDRDYPPFITFLHDNIEEAKKLKKDAQESKEEELESGLELADVVPKILTFAKAVAGRARSIKGKKHEWPLDHLFLHLPKMHFEGLRQAAGRANSTDTRTTGPTTWMSEEMQLKLTNAIVVDRKCSEILRQGNTPLQLVRHTLTEVKSAPEGEEVVAKSGAYMVIGPRGHTRNGVGRAYTLCHDKVTRTPRRGKNNIVSPPTGDAMDEEEEEEEEENEELERASAAAAVGAAAESANDAAEGGPELTLAEFMTNHLDDVLDLMAQALLERKDSMTARQMADGIAGRTGYPSTNIPSLEVVNYIIRHKEKEMEDKAYFLGGVFLP